MGKLCDRRHIRHRAQHVAHVRDGDHLRLRPDGGAHRVHVERAVLGEPHPAQHGAVALAQEMPGHDVGMVLHDRQHDLVARLDPRAERRGDQVDALGRALGEDHIVRGRRIEESAYGFARSFVGLGRLVRQRMQAPVHVGIGGAHLVRHRIDHGVRLLGAGGIVEIDERMPVHLPGQDRELGADGRKVELTQHGSARPAPRRAARLQDRLRLRAPAR